MRHLVVLAELVLVLVVAVLEAAAAVARVGRLEDHRGLLSLFTAQGRAKPALRLTRARTSQFTVLHLQVLLVLGGGLALGPGVGRCPLEQLRSRSLRRRSAKTFVDWT